MSETLRLGPYTYRVVRDDPAATATIRVGEPDVNSQCDSRRHEIVVADDLADGLAWRHLVQQTLAALVYDCQLARLAGEGADAAIDDLIVMCAPRLLSLWRDNPSWWGPVLDLEAPASLPPVIILGPHRWACRYDAEAIAEFEGSVGLDAWAYCDKRRHEIVLEPPGVRNTASRVAESWVHETLHAVVNSWGRPEHVDDHEEPFVTTLAPLLLDALRRNPWLAEGLRSL